MFKWITRLFKRNPPLSSEQIDRLAEVRAQKEIDKIVPEPNQPGPEKICRTCGLDKCREIDPDQTGCPAWVPRKNNPGSDIIARQGGQKRNRYHIYVQPYGYPIRLCDWVAVEREKLEDIYEGVGAVAKTYERRYGYLQGSCSHCLAIARGERGKPYAGLPIPGRVRKGGPK